MSNDPPKFLDVEDNEQRQNRIGALLSRLSTSSSSTLSPSRLPKIGQERPPGPVEPPTELLARVKAFLPTISASNKALSQMKPEDIDIEKIAVDDNQYIEMNLGVGVLEAKQPGSGSRSASPSFSDADSNSNSSSSKSGSGSSRSGSEEESESNSSSSDEGSDSESDSGSSVDMKPVFSRPIKPLPRRVSRQAGD